MLDNSCMTTLLGIGMKCDATRNPRSGNGSGDFYDRDPCASGECGHGILPDGVVFKRSTDHVLGLLTNFFSGPILFSYFRSRDGCENLDH